MFLAVFSVDEQAPIFIVYYCAGRFLFLTDEEIGGD